MHAGVRHQERERSDLIKTQKTGKLKQGSEDTRTRTRGRELKTMKTGMKTRKMTLKQRYGYANCNAR